MSDNTGIMDYTGVGLDRLYFTLKGRKGAPEGMLGFQDCSLGFKQIYLYLSIKSQSCFLIRSTFHCLHATVN